MAGFRSNPLVALQQTLRQPVTYSGIGLHSGNQVTMTLLPASPNTGIRFRRVDLEGKPEVEAAVNNVSQTNRSTTLAKGNVKIQTTEHVLATLAGFEVDNAIIEVDANETPIADGSARDYSRMVEQAGLVQQPEERETYEVTEPLEVEMGDTLISVFPHHQFKVSCTSADKQGRFSQFYSVELTPETWRHELADARTFCFFEELEYLIKNGLIRGGSLENAVVIRDDAVLTTEPLRFPEEFVRHKILDIVGDLSLLGRPVRGHVVAVKPSHAANCELTRQIQAQMLKPFLARMAFAPPPMDIQESPGLKPASSAEAPVSVKDGEALDIMQVMKALPHRYPFLMVDRVLKIDGNKIVALKNVTINEPYFQGHFPSHPIMPGVLQLEAIAQIAGVLMLKQAENFGKLAYFMSAENVKWRKPVRPGDTLMIEVEMTKTRSKIGRAKGVCRVDSEIVSEADVTFMLVDRM